MSESCYAAAEDNGNSSDAVVCYCFLYRRSDIENEVRATGRTTVPDRIAAEVKAGNCACEVRNPTGRCCLGEVLAVVREIQVRPTTDSASTAQAGDDSE